jgi:hypothetical protein
VETFRATVYGVDVNFQEEIQAAFRAEAGIKAAGVVPNLCYTEMQVKGTSLLTLDRVVHLNSLLILRTF